MALQFSLRRLSTSPTLKSDISSTKTLHDQIFKLPDGRSLGYAEYGQPNGHPLLYFHGYPACRLEAEPAEPMAKRLGIRLIALDRPGFGLSTPQPNRTILDWTNDVQAFADGMAIPQFGVMGVSGGGPYALACAYALPKERMTGVGLFASGTPWGKENRKYMTYTRRWTRWMANYWPGGLEVIVGGLLGVTRWFLKQAWVTKRIHSWLENATRKEKNEKSEKEGEEDEGGMVGKTPAQKGQYLVKMMLEEPYTHGCGPMVYEAKLLSADDWGFKFEDVDYDKVRIVHGAKDGNAPVVMIRHLADGLPHCELKVLDDDTHYTMFSHLKAAMKDLVPQNKT